MTLKLRILALLHGCALCADGIQRFGCPVELANIPWSTGCSLGDNGCFHPASPGSAPQFLIAFFIALQSMKLVRLPQTLTLHLKRFCFERSSHSHKLGHSLPFPQELDFREILTENQCQADDSEKAAWQYELFAVVAHSGSTSCGHYCAYIRSLTECKWFCFNDSHVCQVSTSNHAPFVPSWTLIQAGCWLKRTRRGN
ncbi:hypothetical protein Nmel_006163 [Mimus melanotis]